MKNFNIYSLLLLLAFIRKIFDLAFPGKSVLIEFVILAILFILMIGQVSKKGFKVVGKDLLLFTVLILGQVVAMFYSYFFYDMFNKYIYSIVGIFMCFYLMYMSVKKSKHKIGEVENIFTIIILVCVISCIHAMIFQFDSDLFKISSNNNFRMDNIYCSFWGHRNQFGLLLATGIISLQYFILKNKKSISMILLMLLFGINLIFTYSRASYLLIAIFYIYFLLFSSKKTRNQKKMLGFFSLVLLIFIYMYMSNEQLQNYVNKFLLRFDSGLTGRDSLWKTAMYYINLPTLIFGRGIGINKLLLIEDNIGANTGFHNMYLNHIVCGGIVLLIFILIVIRNVIFQLKKKNISNEMKTFFIAIIVGFMGYSFFEVTDFFKLQFQNVIQTLMCITIPLLYTSSMEDEKDE